MFPSRDGKMLNFGTLTQKNKIDIKTFVDSETKDIDYLFKNSRNQLEKLTVIDAERQIALDNLRKLTEELQGKPLAYASNSKFTFFTK